VNLDLSEEQQLLVDSFGRLFAELGGTSRSRERLAHGVDRELTKSLGEMGALAMRSPRSDMGSLSVFEAILLLEQAGRVVASVPLAETLVAVRLIGDCGDAAAGEWFDKLASGDAVVTLALSNAATAPNQLVHFGADADVVVALDGDRLCLYRGGLTSVGNDHGSYRLARFSPAQAEVVAELAQGSDAVRLHAAAVEEWKLLVAAELYGMAGASLDLSVAYAKERQAFGRLIGSFQAIAHPLADHTVNLEGAKLLTWWAAWAASRNDKNAPAGVSMAFFWAISTADQATRRALHTLGGYGLPLEHDSQLYFRRAKARALILGDPGDELARAAERLWLGAEAPTIDAGEVGVDFTLGADAEAIASETAETLQRLMTPERRAKMQDSYEGHNPEIATAMAKEGLLFPSWPKEWGGRDAAPLSHLAILQAWRENGVASHSQTTTDIVGYMIMKFGGEALLRDVMPQIASGEAPCCLGYSEPSGGSDIFAAQTKATWDEHRKVWLINGQKMWTTGANLAKYILILTRTEPGSVRHHGLTLFVLPMDTPGIEVHPIFTMMDERTNTTFYSDVAVPDEYRLGPVGGAMTVMGAALAKEHAGVYGSGDRRYLEGILEWAQKPGADGQIRFAHRDTRKRIARAATITQIEDLLARRAAWYAGAYPNAGRTVYGPMAKLFHGESSQASYADLMDLAAPDSLAGDAGLLTELEHLHRQVQVESIAGGTSEIQRSQIAEVYLGLPKSR
jgi:alkylation response protein AidB-like acyl-CoA dehydrogenase